jgi:nucleotide-binding universal stress UspA family protein
MSWARIMAPLAGAPQDAQALAAGAIVAAPFDAELIGVFAPVDVADLMPWMGEGFMGGVQATALESLREAGSIGQARAKEAFDGCGYAKARFVTLASPVWAGLSTESRLSDLIVFTDDTARGRGPLAQAFQQMVADEQRPVLIARPGLRTDGCMMVAWDGGKEAARAARLALPLLEKAGRVVVVSAPKASSRPIEPERLQSYYAHRGVKAEIEVLSATGDVAHALLDAAKACGADILVAGAFGHPRLQEFVFGGATRTLLNSEGPTLFLSH